MTQLSDHEQDVKKELSNHEKDVITVIRLWKGCWHSYKIMKTMLLHLSDHENIVTHLSDHKNVV